jgi:hypothetical protein
MADYLLDTNVLLRFCDAGSSQHSEAVTRQLSPIVIVRLNRQDRRETPSRAGISLNMTSESKSAHLASKLLFVVQFATGDVL